MEKPETVTFSEIYQESYFPFLVLRAAVLSGHVLNRSRFSCDTQWRVKFTNHFEVLFIDEEDTQKSNKEQDHLICKETVPETDELDLGIEASSDSDTSLGLGQSPSELNTEMEECVGSTV